MNAMKTHHEAKISERIDELCVKVRERSSVPGKPLDFSEHLRQVARLASIIFIRSLTGVCRWFLSDVWSHLVYGEPKGCVAQGRDVNGLLAALQGIYSMSATAAVMPWLMPLLRNPLWRRYFWSWTKTFRNMETLYSVRHSVSTSESNADSLRTLIR